MNELFDLGSRPIRVVINGSELQFLHNKEGWVIATATLVYIYEKIFNVSDAENKFMGRVNGLGNLEALVSQIYDQQYGHMEEVRKRHTKPDQIWVIFGKTTDGVNIATFSREVEAPDLETAKQLVRSELEQVCVDEDISFYAIHGPFSRGSPVTYKNLRT